MLTINGVYHSFKVNRQKKPALRDIHLEIETGEFLTLIGPSGCGKSTLLRILSGIIPLQTGEVQWDKRPKMGFVFQDFALFPFLTVAENIAFGLKMENQPANVIAKKVKELLLEMDLSAVANKHPQELSGGMKQRVGIARALAIDPDVLFLDEPFSALDEFTAEKLRQELLLLWHKRKMTVIMVTHLIREAIELADRIVVMTPAPGQIETVINNTLPRPRQLRSAAFYRLEDELKQLVQV